MSAALIRMRAVAKRDLIIEASYQLRLIIRMVVLLASLIFIYYVSEFVGVPEALGDYRGTYFDYVIIGMATTSYMSLGIGAFVARINQEQGAGTLEVLLAGPTRLSVLLLSGFLVPFALTTLELLIIVGVGLGIVGSGVSLSGLLVAAPLMAFTMVSFMAFGIVGAALVVLAKRGDVLTAPMYQATVAFSGVLFPVSLFPDFIEPVAYLFPSFYGLRGMRDALLGDAGFGEVWGDLLAVAGFAVVLLPLSIWVFARAIRVAKDVGILGTY